MKRPGVTAIVFVAGLALAVQLYLQGGVLPSTSWWGYISPAVSAVLVSVSIFDRYAWKWPVLRLLGGSRPCLHGTWVGSLQSTWVDPATNEVVPPIEAYLVARQTFSSLSIRLLTKESSSKSSTAEIIAALDQTCQVAWVYSNEPRMSVRSRSEIHNGAGSLTLVGGANPSALEGHYWTDRDTKGELHFKARAAGLADSFAQARGLFPAYNH